MPCERAERVPDLASRVVALRAIRAGFSASNQPFPASTFPVQQRSMCEAGHRASSRHSQLVTEPFDAVQRQDDRGCNLLLMEAANRATQRDMPFVDRHIDRSKSRIAAASQCSSDSASETLRQRAGFLRLTTGLGRSVAEFVVCFCRMIHECTPLCSSHERSFKHAAAGKTTNRRDYCCCCSRRISL